MLYPIFLVFIVSDSASRPDHDHKIMYNIGSETLPSTFLILFPKFNILFYSTSNGYKKQKTL